MSSASYRRLNSTKYLFKSNETNNLAIRQKSPSIIWHKKTMNYLVFDAINQTNGLI